MRGKRFLKKLCVMLFAFSMLTQSFIPAAVYAAPAEETGVENENTAAEPTVTSITITSEVKNATAVFDKEEYEAGDTVTVTITPDAGFVITEEFITVMTDNSEEVVFEHSKEGESLTVVFTLSEKDVTLFAEAKKCHQISVNCFDMGGQENPELFQTIVTPEAAVEGETVQVAVDYQGSNGWSGAVLTRSGEKVSSEMESSSLTFVMPDEDVTVRLAEMEDYDKGDLAEGDTDLGEGIGEEHNTQTQKENEPDISLGKTAKWDNIEEGTATITLTEKDTSDWFGRPSDYIFVLDRTTTMSLNYRNLVPKPIDWLSWDNSVCINPNHQYIYHNRKVRMIDYNRGIYADTGEVFHVDGKLAEIWERHYDASSGHNIEPSVENGCIDRLTAAQNCIKDTLDVIDHQNKTELAGKTKSRVMYWTYSGAEKGAPEGLWNEYPTFTTDIGAVKRSMVYQCHGGTHYNNSFKQILRKLKEKQSDPKYKDIPTKVIFISDGKQYGEDDNESLSLARQINAMPFTKMYTLLIGDTKDSEAGQKLIRYAKDEDHFATVTYNWDKFVETITSIRKDQFEIKAADKVLTDRINTKYWEIIGEPVVEDGNGTAAINKAKDTIIWNVPEGEGKTYTCKIRIRLKDEYRYLFSNTFYETNGDVPGATEEQIRLDPSKAGASMTYRIDGGEFHEESRRIGIKSPKLKYGTVNFEGQKQWLVEGSNTDSVTIRLKRTMPGTETAVEVNNETTNITKNWKYSFSVRRKPDGSTLPLIKYNNAGKEISYEVIEELPDYYHQTDKEVQTEGGKVITTFKNEPFKVNVKLQKIDEETKNPLSGAEFSIYTWSAIKKSYVPYKGTNTSMNGGDSIVKLTEGEKGIYTSPVWLYYSKDNQGKFRLMETKAPDGYFGDWKVDALTGSNKDKNVYDFEISKDRDKNKETVNISNREDGKFGDQRVKGMIEYSKLDQEGKIPEAQGEASLKGALYKLYAARDIVHQDGTTGVLHPAGEEIKVTKVSEKNGVPVYRYDRNGIDEIVTGDNGKFRIEGLELGVYNVREVRASEGYLIDPLKYGTTLAYQGEKQTVVQEQTSVFEPVKKQNLTFYKYTADNNSDQLDPMKGAEFSVYLVSELCGGKYKELSDEDLVQAMIDDMRDGTTLKYDMSGHKPASVFADKDSEDVRDGRLVKRYVYDGGKDYTVERENEYLVSRLVSDEKGHVKTPELPYGRYIVIETKTPEGKLATRPFVINVTDDGHDGTAEGDGQGTPLQDMQLTVLVDRPIMSLIRIMKRDEHSNKTVLKEGAEYVIHDMNGSWFDYISKEMTSSQKKAYKEKFGDLVAQYSQGIYYGTKEEPFVTKLVKGEKDETANVYIETPQQLPSGIYELEEIKAPDGYILQGQEGVIAKNESLPGNGTFHETEGNGKWKKTPKGRVRFIVSNNESVYDETIMSFVTTVRQDNEPAVGKISIYAEGEKLVSAAPEGTTWVGRLLGKAADLFGFGTAKGELLTDEEIAQFKDYEFNYELRPVEGAQFEIRAAEDITSPEGGVNAERLFNEGDLVATLTTDENGQTWTGQEDWEGTDIAKGLPLGKYTVTQTRAGEGFALSEENALPRQIEISYAGQTVPVIYKDTSYINPRRKVRIEVTKTDGETGEKLGGAVFGLYAKEDIKNEKGRVVVKAGTQIGIAETVLHNHVVQNAKFAGDLPGGSYEVREVKAPDGYFRSEDVYEFDALSADDGISEVLYFHTEFQNTPASVEVQKTDLYIGEMISGAKLQILEKETGKVEETWITDGTKRTIKGLKMSEEKEHSYLLREVQPANGYVTADEIEFRIVPNKGEEGELLKTLTVYVREGQEWKALSENVLDMKDDVTKIEIKKTDQETGEMISGARLELRDSSGKVLSSWISSEKQGHRIERLPIGVYRILETERMDGYQEANPLVIHVEDRKETQVFVFENQPEKKKETKPSVPESKQPPSNPVEIIRAEVSTGDTAPVLLTVLSLGVSFGAFLFIFHRRKKS